MPVDDLIPLKDAVTLIPPSPKTGDDWHPSTLRRWASDGVKGKLLRVLYLGQYIYTTERWLQMFLAGEGDPKDQTAGGDDLD